MFALYNTELQGPNAYDFSRLPDVSESPPFPVVNGGSLYDFRRGRCDPLPPPVGCSGVVRGADGMCRIEQTNVWDLEGMLTFFDKGLVRRLKFAQRRCSTRRGCGG